jgi:hypothetical protein
MNNDKIVKSFKKFVKNHRTYSSKQITHIIKKVGDDNNSKRNTDQNYSFEGIDYLKFLELYAQVLEKSPETELRFIEKPGSDNATLLIVPLRFLQKMPHRIYSEKHIELIIEELNNILEKTFSVEKSELESFVTATAKPRDCDENGHLEEIYIYYPKLPLSEEARFYVLELLSQSIAKNNFLKGIPVVTPLNKIVDKSIVISDGVMMFGSRFAGSDSHHLSTIYNRCVNIVDSTDEYDYTTILNLFSNRQYNLELCNEFKNKSTEKEASIKFKDYA